MKKIAYLILLLSFQKLVVGQPCTYRDSFTPNTANICATYSVGPYVGGGPFFCTGAGYTSAGSGWVTLFKFCTDSSSRCINFNITPTTLTGNMEIVIYSGCWNNSPSGLISNSSKCLVNSTGSYSTEGLNLAPNQCYVLTIWTKDTGRFQLCRQLFQTPTDDTCLGATTIPFVATSYNTACYTHNPAREPNNACAPGLLRKSRWFKHTLICDTFARFNYGNMNCVGGSGGFNISYYIGSCSSLSYLGCTIGTSGSFSTTISGLSIGQTIYVLINGNQGANCNFTLRVDSSIAIKTINQNFFICQGQSIVLAGASRNATGTFRDTVWKTCQSTSFIDSIKVYNLTVKPTSTIVIDTSICQGKSIFFKGQNRTTAGTYIDTLVKVNGCDSIRILNLSIRSVSSKTIDTQICQGKSVFFKGMPRTTAGTYIDTLVNAVGCDSIVTLLLTVNPTPTTNIFSTICQGSSRWFKGLPRTTTGVYRDTLLTTKNCDSFVILNLTVKPTSNKTIDTSICNGKFIFFKGQNRTTAGTYNDTLLNSVGCDSFVTLNLSISPPISSSLTVSICQGQAYFFKGQNRTAAGTYVDTLQSSKGCDSIVTLQLNVNPVKTTNLNINLCPGGSYFFKGQNRTTAGIYRDTLQTILGCDSFVVLTLNVLPYLIKTINTAICQGQSIFFKGQNRTTAGTYRDTFSNPAPNCDSILILNLSIKNTSTTQLFDSICQGQTKMFKGIARTTTGVYRDTLINAVGCDSIVILNLLVKPTPTVNAGVDTFRVNCAGDSVRIGTPGQTGHTYLWSPSTGLSATTVAQPFAKPTSTTTYVLEATLTASGCKLRDTMTVSVQPSNIQVAIRKYLRMCKGNTGQTLGGSPTASMGNGPYTYTWTPSTYLSNNTLSNPTITNAPHGTYTYTLEVLDSRGCIGRDTTRLLVDSLPKDAAGKDTNICKDGSLTLGKAPQNKINYAWNPTTNLNQGNIANPSFSSSTSGNFQYILTVSDSANTCSLNDTLLIQVNPPKFDTLRPSICAGQSYFFNGAPRTTSGTYFFSSTTSKGCDSSVVLFLTVKNTSSKTIDSQICQGKSVFFKGQNRTTTGTYRDTLINANNCDSFVTLNLVVHPTPTTNLNISICQGQSYTFKGVARTSSGIYRDTLLSSKNCDSFIILNLNVSPKSLKTIDTAICKGKSVFFKGQWRSTSMTLMDTLFNAAGCDSIVTLNLSIKDTSTRILYDTICKNSSRLFNSTLLKTTGIYKDTLVNAQGCDSFLYLHLYVKDTSSRQLFDTICSNQFRSFNGVNYTTTGIYRDTLVNKVGCDSFIYLHLFVKPTSSFVITTSICANQSYFFKGQFRNTAGIYRDTLTNANGCDSFLTLNLSIKSLTTRTIDTAICKGQSYLFKGIARTAAGTYRDTLVNAQGCDSFLTLNLSFKDTSSYSYSQTICNNQPLWFNGQFRNTTGQYKDTLTNAVGCDSFVYLNLIVNNTITTLLRDTLCSNEFYLFKGQNLNVSGTYRDTLTSANGCDSFVILNLFVWPLANSTRTIQLCQGGSYFFKGQNLNVSGTYRDTLINGNGCDSFITLNLIVNPLPVADAGIDQTRVNCEGDSVQLGTNSNVNYTYSWTPTLGLNAASIAKPYSKTSVATTYELLVTDRMTGCQSRDSVWIDVLQSQLTAETSTKNLRCYNDNSGELLIQASDGYPPYGYKVDATPEFQSSNSIQNLSATSGAQYTIRDSKGCLVSGTYTLTQPDSISIQPIQEVDLKCFQDGSGKIEIQVQGGIQPYTYQWDRSASTSALADQLAAGMHTVTVRDDSACAKPLRIELQEPDPIRLVDSLKYPNACFGDSAAKLDVRITGGTEPYTYRWSNGGNQAKIEKLKEGTYSLTVEDKNICRDSFSIQLKDPALLKIDSIYSEDLNCKGNGMLRIHTSGGTPPFAYSISGGDTYKKDSQFLLTKTGLYPLVVLDKQLCSARDSIVIGEQASVKIKVTPSASTLSLGEQISLGFQVVEGDSNRIQTLAWSPTEGLSCSDCPQPMASPFVSQIYTLEIKYADECSHSDYAKILVQSQDELYVPNAFSPSAEQTENQRFKIYGKNILRALLSIYNRWGEKVFDGREPHILGWDGAFNGQPSPAGVYYYHLEVTYLNGSRIVRKGDINLLR